MAGVRDYLNLVRFEHSIFALPFAYLGVAGADLWLARNPRAGLSGVDWVDVALVTLAMVAARTLAMVVNRVTDREIDAKNPRTEDREIPSGKVPLEGAVTLGWASAAGLLLATVALCWINLTMWPLALLPVALAFLVGYSYTKRFTWTCHWILGATDGAAPLAAWLAAGALWHPAPLWLGLGVTLWVGGFDVIYSLQDVEFDREEGIRAVPADLGKTNARLISVLSHIGALAAFWLAGTSLGLDNLWYFAGVGVSGLILAVEHTLVALSEDYIGPAFFTANGALAIVFLGFAWAGMAAALP